MVLLQEDGTLRQLGLSYVNATLKPQLFPGVLFTNGNQDHAEPGREPVSAGEDFMLIKDDQQWRGNLNCPLNPSFWDLKLRAQLGRDLRRRYERTLKEPLPDRLARLLARLEQQERGQ